MHKLSRSLRLLDMEFICKHGFKSGNDASDEHKGGIFGEYPNDEEASRQIETDMDS